jgi:PAS domain S-box-containing protein
MVARDLKTPTALRHALGTNFSRDSLRETLARVSTAVLIADGTQCYVAVNDLACSLTGYTEAELLRMSLPDLTAAVDARASEVLWRAFMDTGEQRGEFTVQRKNGTTVLVRYEAVANITPALHASFLTPIE